LKHAAGNAIDGGMIVSGLRRFAKPLRTLLIRMILKRAMQ